MEIQKLIYSKLESFIKKYYTNELIRGSIFFIGLGLLYFLVTVFIEYLLWLPPAGRTLLFIAFVGTELFLLIRFIAFPMFKLFKLKKGINYQQASSIIGNHFPEVSDKLINFLQLSENNVVGNNSELWLASIEQKANDLAPIPFVKAINFSSNRKYYPVAIVPVICICFIYFSGNSAVISQGLNRVVRFNTSFSPPAPFTFNIKNKDFIIQEGKDFILNVETVGKVVPENVVVKIGDESYFMEVVGGSKFQYKFSKPASDIDFSLEANGIESQDYHVSVVAVPAIANFEMRLDFPAYINRNSESVKGTGNAIVPEGTRVRWVMLTQATQSVVFNDGNQVFKFNKIDNSFSFTKSINQDTEYQIVTSNSSVQNFEKLNYRLNVVKDQFPSINAAVVPDSLKVDTKYIVGQIADDYGISKLQVVYYDRDNISNVKRGTITFKKGSIDQFVFAFPAKLPVQKGVVYDYYFEVFDNDVIHNFKSSRSAVFSSRVVTDTEKEQAVLQEQNDNIQGLQKSLKAQDKQIDAIDKLQKSGKEKDNFDFKDQQKVDDFIKQQSKQDEIVKDFTKKLNDNLSQFKSDKKDLKKEELQKRLDKAEEESEKNKKLLDELQKLNDKIQSEELLSKLDKFKQNSKNQIKNLEQLVELTKRYYVEKKAEQVADKLEKLSESLDKNSESKENNTTKKQEDINRNFDKIQNELKELRQENKQLKSPLDIPNDAAKEKSIDDDLDKANDDLTKNKQEKAKSNQKSASKKMKEMAQKMQVQLEQSEKNQMQEDVAMLRQVLDNLLAYSVSQEDLMEQFKGYKTGAPSFNKNIKIQQDLKQQFKHVDDSLFALSLRNPKIEGNITKEIGNVSYNVDNAISSFTETQLPKGISHQQYAVAASNKLADFLSEILSNMQMQLSGMGNGKPQPGHGSGMQLPDIIQKQDGLGEKMKQGSKEGNKSGSGKPGSDGKAGMKGSGGEEGEGDAELILQIYQEQKLLRESLQNELNKHGAGGLGQNAVEQMKQLEKQILNKGFKNETLQRILNIKQELLKLKTALQQQGQDNSRQAEGSRKEFNNRVNALPSALSDYLNSIEILNRQSLPLRSNFNQKVQEYFNKK
ncbi:hypothetical protein [Flavobacterium turcicum]|uniref:ATPase n=1 Tax=Flavobacterium turcicum TaxID=2764718 RepID=A0ABR7JBS1_9FLAO|nr:hypothetical protein [Flavobacterium turcicum]MBC5861947.1 hypothetical protein [Flavobacterium turcicum]NHL00678.1 hypothetical protein [Flavobacterium turcicum]